MKGFGLQDKKAKGDLTGGRGREAGQLTGGTREPGTKLKIIITMTMVTIY